jgi:hypothetical protein
VSQTLFHVRNAVFDSFHVNARNFTDVANHGLNFLRHAAGFIPQVFAPWQAIGGTRQSVHQVTFSAAEAV